MPITPGLPINPYPWWETYEADAATLAAAAVTQNVVYLKRLKRLSQRALTTTISHYTGTANLNHAKGLYTFDGTAFTRVANTGSVAGVATTKQSDAVLTPYWREAGADHWAAFATNGSGVTVARLATTPGMSRNHDRYILTSGWDATDGLPATILLSAVTTGTVVVWMQGD